MPLEIRKRGQYKKRTPIGSPVSMLWYWRFDGEESALPTPGAPIFGMIEANPQ
jgi:hypothetical protein